ncbi:MAG: 1-acyl-sn-glycerol-3-phosphate acyltransferase [Lachnospiraceae bacterium]|nr:1-acyl-sn-glycerol-3-phosphate acyltransferase [Lachnospiraceae bacterium]
MNRILMMVAKNFWKVPGAYAKLCYYAKHTDEYPENVKYNHIRYILQLAVKSGNIDLQIYGKENIPKENGFVMIANHQGLFDILAMVNAIERPWAAILKKELYSIPFMKQLVYCTKSYPMDRDDIRQSMEVIIAATKEVKSGRNYLIFPEGTRSKNGNNMLEFHSGSFKIATKAKAPILPIALIDSFKVLDQKGSAPVAVQIHFLEPILYEEYKEMNTVELAAMVHSRIENKIKERI